MKHANEDKLNNQLGLIYCLRLKVHEFLSAGCMHSLKPPIGAYSGTAPMLRLDKPHCFHPDGQHTKLNL